MAQGNVEYPAADPSIIFVFADLFDILVFLVVTATHRYLFNDFFQEISMYVDLHPILIIAHLVIYSCSKC